MLVTNFVAVQTVNEIYKVSKDEEALDLLADISCYVRSMKTSAYPSRYAPMHH